MANIKIEIKINEEQSLIFDNEKILSFSTRSRTTSEPEKPVFNVFSSEATLVVKDDDLSLYNQGQQGLFDSYEYPAIISLNEVQIAKHKIIERPNYNYRDKTLTIQFGNSIDMFDELTYEGYTYPGIDDDYDFPIEPQPLIKIFEHIFAKAFNITGSYGEIAEKIWGSYDVEGYFKYNISDLQFDDYDGGSRKEKTKMDTIMIDYPYMPSKSFREAFSNVLARAKLSMVLNYDGYFKLVDMEKTLSDIVPYGAVVIPNDYISSPFETSVILDNKYDNVQVSCSEIITSVKEESIYKTVEKQTNNIYASVAENYYPEKIYSFYATITSNGQYNANFISLEKENKINVFDGKQIIFKKYGTLYEILNANDLLNTDIAITFKIIEQTYSGGTGGLYANFNGGISGTRSDTELLGGEPYYSFYNINPQESISYKTLCPDDYKTTIFSEGFSSDGNTSGVLNRSVDFSFPDYFLSSQKVFQFDGTNYYLNPIFTSGIEYTYVYCCGVFDCTGSENSFATFNIEKSKNLPNYTNGFIKKTIKYIPENITFDVKGNIYNIDFNNSDVQKLGTSKNVATINNCGEMLQYSGELTNSEPVKYIEDIAGYYSNGLHTAKVKVIGGKKYLHKDGTKFNKPLFTMGDIVDIKGYDNNSIMKYPRTNMAINWQVVSNEFEFEGGACYQNLELKELPHYSQGLNFAQKGDETGVYYSVEGIGECDDLNIIVPPIYMGKPVKEINNLRSERIESVSMPNTITTIGSQAFENCVKISQVSIPNSVTTIGLWAFKGCSSLQNITIPDSVTYIGSGAFKECSSLKTITLPFIGESTEANSTNTYLGHIFGATSYENNYAFVPDSLKDVVITSATVIDKNAFYGCNSLQNITIPNTVTSVGENAFYGCSNLKYEKDENNSNCYYLGNDSNHYLYLAKVNGKSYSSLSIHENCKIIGSNAFTNCSFSGYIGIKNATFITKNAFTNCSFNQLTDVKDETWEASANLSFSEIEETITFNKTIANPAATVKSYNENYYLRKKS